MPCYPGTAMPEPRVTLQQRLHRSVQAAFAEKSPPCPGQAFIETHGAPESWTADEIETYLDLTAGEAL
jgi:hypothetical protein